MCRLFISLDPNESFHELNKYYNNSETKQMIHGFGIGEYTNNNWKFNKSLSRLYKSPIYEEFINENTNEKEIIVAHARQIYTRELPKNEIDKYYTPLNVHPFQYKEFWLAHHGNLFLEQNHIIYRFQTNINLQLFISKINELCKNHIHKSLNKFGNTDSEMMFYLFLSLYRKNNEGTERSIMIKSFIEMVEIINEYSFINVSNLLIANRNYIIIANIYKTNTPEIKPIYLYKKENTFCSTRLDKLYTKISLNTFFIYNINTGNIKSYSI